MTNRYFWASGGEENALATLEQPPARPARCAECGAPPTGERCTYCGTVAGEPRSVGSITITLGRQSFAPLDRSTIEAIGRAVRAHRESPRFRAHFPEEAA